MNQLRYVAHRAVLSLVLSVCIGVTVCTTTAQAEVSGDANDSASTKLSWFIPDGLRADPELFDIFRWANEGKLPNIKRMMKLGSYGYSIPVFPSHTPANFAALLTGMYPQSNGVPDGPMRIEGQSLQKPAVAGFSSSARKVPAIWGTLGESKSVVLLSMPGSTPPELKRNAVTIRGRWGGWGADFQSVIYEKMSIERRTQLAKNSRLFMFGMELTQFIEPNESLAWPNTPLESKALFLRMEYQGAPIFAKIFQQSDPTRTHYDSIAFSRDMIRVDAVLSKGQWSDWVPYNVVWNERTVKTNLKFHVISLGPGTFFRIRVLADSINEFIVEPSQAAVDISKDVGPMVDFPDNFPPQLIYFPEDKKTLLKEVQMSMDWHRKAVDSIYARYNPDVFVHDIYTPNQMLTSRWWMGYLDPNSSRYHEISKEKRDLLWREVKDMYRGIDEIVGKTLDHADKNTLIVFSSDHGVIPLNSAVLLNNLFAKNGWITYGINSKTGEAVIDWAKSQVVFLKMTNIYINPTGLGPVYTRASGPAYEDLRNKVIKAVESLRDEKAISPLDNAVKWEDVGRVFKLPPDRTGDLVVSIKAGYGWAEDITPDLRIFAKPIEAGYKQAVVADNVKGLWAPFIIVGKGIKKNFPLTAPIKHVDQLPTIMRAMNLPVPSGVEGVVINEIFR